LASQDPDPDGPSRIAAATLGVPVGALVVGMRGSEIGGDYGASGGKFVGQALGKSVGAIVGASKAALNCM
jgi:hypothetical protein